MPWYRRHLIAAYDHPQSFHTKTPSDFATAGWSLYVELRPPGHSWLLQALQLHESLFFLREGTERIVLLPQTHRPSVFLPRIQIHRARCGKIWKLYMRLSS